MVMAMDEKDKDFEEFVKKNPDEAVRIIVKAFKEKELLKIGNRSYVDALRYPESHFDIKELMPDGGSLQVFNNDMLQPLRDPTRVFSDQIVIPPSYLIWTSGTNVYAKNGLTGQIEFSGTDAATVIQSAINALGTTGGEIFIKAGEYVIKSVLTIPGHISLIGEEKGRFEEGKGVRFKLGADIPNMIISANTVDNWAMEYSITIENIDFNGNKSNRNDGNGLHLIGCEFVTLKNLRFINFPKVGLILRKCHFVTIEVVGVSQCGGADPYALGLGNYSTYLRLGENSHILGLRGGNGNSGHMHMLDSCWDTLFEWVEADSAPENGIYLNNVDRCTFVYTRSGYNKKHGIFGTVYNSVFIGGQVLNNGIASANTYDGLHLYNSQYNTIIGIYGYDTQSPHTQRYPFIEEGTSDYNLFISNHIINNLNNAILLVGANSKAKYNSGYVTEKSRTATFSGDGTTKQFKIAHGLASTPTTVTVTPASSDASGSFYVTVDATYIYVNYITAPPAGTNNVVLNWYASL
jgi:hypothetical protein